MPRGLRQPFPCQTRNGCLHMCFVLVFGALIRFSHVDMLCFVVLYFSLCVLHARLIAGGVDQGDCSSVSVATAKYPSAARLHFKSTVVFLQPFHWGPLASALKSILRQPRLCPATYSTPSGDEQYMTRPLLFRSWSWVGVCQRELPAPRLSLHMQRLIQITG